MSSDETDSANVDPASVWVWLVCTDCENAVHIAMAAGRGHVSVGRPCYCGGVQVLLRDLQRQARLGRKIEALPS